MRFFKCKKCGKIIALVNEKPCPTMCCGEAMEEMIPGTSDGAVEKHVPAVTVCGNTVTVNVGSVDHPMLDEHFIEWVAIKTAQGAQRKLLKPGDAPNLTFALVEGDSFVEAYAYCNLHGLWKS